MGSHGQRRALIVIAGGLMLSMTTWFSTAAVLPELRERWSLTTNEASLLIVVLQLGFVAGACAVAVGGLADRLPPRRLLLMAAVGAAGCNALVVAADGYRAALMLRFLTGACLAGVYPVALKLTATWFNERRGMAMGTMVGALALGSAGAHAVNAFGGAAWTTVMLVTSATTLAGGLIVGLVAQVGPHPFPPTRFELRSAWQALTARDVRLASFAYFGHMWELYAAWAWIALFLRERAEQAGVGVNTPLLAFVAIGLGAPGSVVAGLAGDRFGKARAAIAAMLISGAASLTIGFAGLPFGAVVALAMVWGASVVADSAQFSAIVSERADQRYVGTALTAQLAVGFVITVATIWLVPLVRDAAGWWAALALLAPGPFLGAFALGRLDRRVATPTRPAST